jgi:LysM repeat protein
MIRTCLFTLLFIVTAHSGFAQAPELIIKSSDNGFYLDHKVAAKENFYSIGRLYNVPPKDIAAYNKLDMTGLNLGQVIRIPLSAANFSQTVNAGTPVYYKVGENESLLKVSNANNKVLMGSLRKWNSLTSDKINAGNKLVVGFLISNQMPVAKTPEKKETVTVSAGKTERTFPSVVISKEPVVEKPVVKAETQPTVVKTEPETEKKVTENPVTQNEITKPVVADQGYFKWSFDQQVKTIPVSKEETVTSGIFKTASGWQDAKYYALIDGIQSGTIIKIANPSNNKVVYAKVLGEISGVRQNAGLNLRISNSAASALDITEQDKFVVKVNY